MMVLTAVDPQRIVPAKKQLVRLRSHQTHGCENSCKQCDPDVYGCAPGTSVERINEKDKDQDCMVNSVSTKFNVIRSPSREALGVLKRTEDFELLDKLGQGFFGTVYKVREKCPSEDNRDFAEPVVMKIPILHSNSCRVSAKRIVMKEDFMLRLLEHPNILKSRGICVQRSATQWQLNLLVDFCDGGSLQQLIVNTQKPFPWLQRCLIALDVCQAMSYVHGRGFMHRDLTSMNILLRSQPNLQFPKAVVADFGLSSKIPQYPTIFQQVGTQNWMAPEMLKEEFYNEKADIFSFGVIMCQMIARIDADHDAGLYRTPCFGLDYCRFTASCPSETPLTLLKIAFMCCLWNPESRPSFDVLLDQIVELTRQNTETWNFFPRENVLSPGEIRLGRSRSDAAIRGANAATSILSSRFCILPGTEEPKKRRTRLANKQFRRIESTLTNAECMIPEGKTFVQGSSTEKHKSNCVFGISPANKKSVEVIQPESFKKLAASVANEDPGYQESEHNPFASHARYRSIRKMKPRDSVKPCGHRPPQNPENADSLSTTESMLSSTSTNDANCCQIHQELSEDMTNVLKSPAALYKSAWSMSPVKVVSTKRERFRSLSLPSSFVFRFKLDSPERTRLSAIGGRSSPFSPVLMKKMSVTLGLGEQRDLQGRITLSFRDYDDKFTSWRYITNRHTMQKVSSQVSFESPEPVPLPSNMPSDPLVSLSPCTSSQNSISSHNSCGKPQTSLITHSIHTPPLSPLRHKKASVELPRNVNCCVL